MAENIVLTYLIEGSQKLSFIPVSQDSNVYTLRKNIFEARCRRLADTDDNLTILKINVDPDHAGNYLPLLRFNGVDEGVEEISPLQTIRDIWPEQPPARRIHIFVTFTELSLEMDERRAVLEAAHHVYYAFWGKDLDEILQPVSDCDKFKYLTEEQIKFLKLRDLHYAEVVLLARDEYEDSYEALCSLKEIPTIGGVVVTGQPGIGKTCFLYYLLFRLLNKKQAVAFQVDKVFVFFQHTGVRLSDDTGRLPYGTWALSDSHTHFEKPCSAFLTGNVWVVQTTSPSRDRWSSWLRERSAVRYWMKVFSLDEMIALGTIRGLDLKLVGENYNLWGPSARTCISLTISAALKDHRLAVTSSARSFTKNFDPSEELDVALASHRLIVVQPTIDSRQEVTAKFVSEYLLTFVARAYARHDHAVRQRFYKAMSGHAWYGAVVGHIFKTSVFLWFRHARDRLPCVPVVDSLPGLAIPACRDNMQFFSEEGDLKDVDEHDLPRCLVPVSQTFPTLDAIVITGGCVITVQFTVAHAHDARGVEFQKVYNNLPHTVLNGRRRCHVFVTDTEGKAASLREQQQTIPTNLGISVYSTFVGVNQLDLIVTEKRMDELENAIEHAQQMDTSE